MSVYVGIDVHRKRSQVAVINEGGEVLANRNVPNGVKPILSVIGELPAGTPAAYEAAFGWGWLLELLEVCRSNIELRGLSWSYAAW
jgi:transposase